MKISAYCTTRNCDEMEYPYLASISSHLAFADEVVVYDTSNGKDKTLEWLNNLASREPKLKIIHSDKIDWKLNGRNTNLIKIVCISVRS